MGWCVKNNTMAINGDIIMSEKTYTVEQIYQMLMTNTFEMWYGDTFQDHVVGEWGVSKEQVLEELEVLVR